MKKDLQTDGRLVSQSTKPAFKNQAMVKAIGRSQLLEALTANKGGKTGRKGLIFRILESLDRDIQSPDPEIYQPARAEALKMALAMTKDDTGQKLTDLLKTGQGLTITFNNYFEGRANPPAIPTTGQVTTD